MPNKLKITPHEPGQPLVGAEESFEDAKLLLRLLDEKRERIRKAKQKLREMGMTVLDEEYQIPFDYLARNLNEGDLVEVKQEPAIKGGIVSKQIHKILTDLTGETRFDIALHLATKELLRLKLQEVEREIKAFEERYCINFDDFKRAWDEGKIADKNLYEVEKDYWDWEALVTNREHLEEMLGFLT